MLIVLADLEVYMPATKSKIVSISLPPDMTKEIQDVAREERRSVSKVMREAFRQYSATRSLKDVRKVARSAAKKNGIKSVDVNEIVRQGRRSERC